MSAQIFSTALLTIVVTLTEQIAAGQIGARSRSTAAVPTTKSVKAARQVIESFGRYNLVGLGERHGNLEDSQFRLRIIRDPEFAQRVNDVVIEFGNPLYQDILDRFVEGANVSHVELSKVWKETTQRGTSVWNSPIYEELIVAVRAVNAAMPSGKHLRVLAADYPIDWTLIDAEKAKLFPREDVIRALWKNVRRDVAAADIIRRSVLDPGRKALVIFGGNHFFRNDSSELINLFQEDSRAKWFSITPSEEEVCQSPLRPIMPPKNSRPCSWLGVPSEASTLVT